MRGEASEDGEDMLTVQSRIAEAERAKGDEPSVIRTSFFDTSDNSKISLCQRFFGCHRQHNKEVETTSKSFLPLRVWEITIISWCDINSNSVYLMVWNNYMVISRLSEAWVLHDDTMTRLINDYFYYYFLA